MVAAAGRVGRQRLRDEVLLKLMYQHGLRASEASIPSGQISTCRQDQDRPAAQGSIDSVHTLDRDEVSALRRLKAVNTSPFVFVSERGVLSLDMIARIVEWAAERHGRRIIRRDISSSLARA